MLRLKRAGHLAMVRQLAEMPKTNAITGNPRVLLPMRSLAVRFPRLVTSGVAICRQWFTSWGTILVGDMLAEPATSTEIHHRIWVVVATWRRPLDRESASTVLKSKC